MNTPLSVWVTIPIGEADSWLVTFYKIMPKRCPSFINYADNWAGRIYEIRDITSEELVVLKLSTPYDYTIIRSS